jgi:hypothetical protein
MPYVQFLVLAQHWLVQQVLTAVLVAAAVALTYQLAQKHFAPFLYLGHNL